MDFSFVLVDNSGMPKGRDKSRVRSHCMRGRNRRENSRRSLQALRNREALPASTSGSSSSACSRDRVAIERSQGQSLDEAAITSLELCTRLLLPSRCITDLDLLPDTLNKDSKELLCKYVHLKEAIYPIYHCIEFEVIDDSFVGLVATDASFTQSLIFVGSALQDFALQRPLTKSTCFHLKKTLSLLNESLSNSHVHANDAILYIVANLSLIASIVGEDEALKIHLAGLRQIIQLRNQNNRHKVNSLMGFKIDRLNLSVYMSTGTVPPPPVGPMSWVSPQHTRIINRTDSSIIPQLHDQHLDLAFLDLRSFVHQINQRHEVCARVAGHEFQASISSIQSRLLSISLAPENVLGECMRLGMLAFLSTTLYIPGRKLSGLYLAAQLQQSYYNLVAQCQATRIILMWLLMVGSISVFDPQDGWVRAEWSTIAGIQIDWEQLKQQLGDIMWIDCIHEEPGIKAFSAITSDGI